MTSTILIFEAAAWLGSMVWRMFHPSREAAFPNDVAGRPDFDAVLSSADAYEKPEFV